MASHSCPRCSWLVLRSETGHSPYLEVNQRIAKEDEFLNHRDHQAGTFEWNFVWPILYNASDGGCELLQSLFDRFLPEPAKFPNIHALRGRLLQDEYKLTTLEVWMIFDSLILDAPPGNLLRMYANILGYLELFTHSGGLCSEWIGTRPVQLRPDSEHEFSLIKSWIDECKTTHVQTRHGTHPLMPEDSEIFAKCTSGATYTPSRLVHVAIKNSVWELSLVSTASGQRIIESYLALSYCWGGDQPFKTIKKGLRESKGLMDYRLLPATIQDACKVTHNLGYAYLWVDSLCIIQDDEDEIHREIANMKMIYENAIVTIAASRAPSATKGFLHTRELEGLFPLKLRAKGRGGIVDEVKVVVYGSYDDQPLDKRAWALQETLLSTRVLEYTDRVTRFSCITSCTQQAIQQRNGNESRYKTDGWRGHRADGHSALWRRVVNTFPATFQTLETAEAHWRLIIQAYSNRELSVPADRPLAISGVAERMNRSLRAFTGNIAGDDYLAGHWISSILWSLSWHVNWVHADDRPKTYQGPSWSWLAVSSPVVFQRARESEDPEPAMKILATEARLKEPSAPYGQFTYAMITAEVSISVVTITKEDQWSKCRLSRKAPVGGASKTLDVSTWVFFDTACEVMKPSETKVAFLVLLARHHAWDGTKRTGALVCRLDGEINGKRSFVRIGWCQIPKHGKPWEDAGYVEARSKEFLEGWDQEIICLI